ncbi:hypothetical protein OG613_48630 (plasmid) [Streptomyces sp. NBC_00015]|uniref:hypothetical protein n=1 Tax=Streptomyces sp. NBC_00015 TaxID=2903611 RepID=UPI0032462B94
MGDLQELIRFALEVVRELGDRQEQVVFDALLTGAYGGPGPGLENVAMCPVVLCADGLDQEILLLTPVSRGGGRKSIDSWSRRQ